MQSPPPYLDKIQKKQPFFLSEEVKKIVFFFNYGLEKLETYFTCSILCLSDQGPSRISQSHLSTERPVRPRVSAPTIMYIRDYVYLCHTPVTLIKSSTNHCCTILTQYTASPSRNTQLGKVSRKKVAVLLNFVQITSTPPPPNLDNLYYFFERQCAKKFGQGSPTATYFS